VLIYDKRGVGASTGTRLDASTATVTRPAPYPDDLANDALAAMHLLKQHPAVDPRKIGFWGSSEGGMLATQVAARAKDVAFAINSSGFMEPLWQTLRYQVRPSLRNAGATEAAIKRQEDLVDLWLQVSRTGQGWGEFEQRRQQITALDGDWFFHTRGTFTSPAQMHRDWESVLSFDPLPRLGNVSCPILAVFGELDTSTPAARTAENMRRVLAESGHRDFTIKVFPGAGHSLMELPEKKRMAPGVFETLRSWLLEHMK
jgi:pimeloyl-ACP methyl ester carboxylesterase